MRSLKVNEIELILRNAFNLDHFALGGEKESKYDKKNPFLGAPCSKLTCLLTLTFRNMHNGCFQAFFGKQAGQVSVGSPKKGPLIKFPNY